MATAAEGGEVSAEFFGMLDVLSGQPAFFFQMPDDGIPVGRAQAFGGVYETLHLEALSMRDPVICQTVISIADIEIGRASCRERV